MSSQCSKAQTSEAIKQCELLKDIPYRNLRKLSQSVTIRSCENQETIIMEGSYDDDLFFVISGHVRALRTDEQGEMVELGILGPGDFFGELTLLDNQPRSATIATVEPSELLCVPKAAFFDVCWHHPRILFNILRQISVRFRKMNDGFYQQRMKHKKAS